MYVFVLFVTALRCQVYTHTQVECLRLPDEALVLENRETLKGGKHGGRLAFFNLYVAFKNGCLQRMRALKDWVWFWHYRFQSRCSRRFGPCAFILSFRSEREALVSFVVIGTSKTATRVDNNRTACLFPVWSLRLFCRSSSCSFLPSFNSVLLKQIEIFVLDGLASAVGDAVLKQ